MAGIRLGVAETGIKYSGRHDLALIEIADEAVAAAVFTRNAFCAAPVSIARQHLRKMSPRYLLVNAGNANAGTGEQGVAAALETCQEVAKLAQVPVESVLPFSTGVIGEQLPVEEITAQVPVALSALDENHWQQAAAAILTTDLVSKTASQQVSLGDETVTITGIAKGSGMICPDMATMLAFVATDASIDETLLQQLLQQAVVESFNRITVDGDTSTNDSCVLIATGQTEAAPLTEQAPEQLDRFREALLVVFKSLALQVVKDGEGATKLVRVQVDGGRTSAECFEVAYTVAHSPLVKTALFASDPNWGRILAAVGRCRLEALDVSKVSILLDKVCVIRDGLPCPDYTEMDGIEVMQQSAITIEIDLGRGSVAEHVWTTDLSYDYIKINAEYRT